MFDGQMLLPVGAFAWPLVLSIVYTTDGMDRSSRAALRMAVVLAALLLPGVKGVEVTAAAESFSAFGHH